MHPVITVSLCTCAHKAQVVHFQEFPSLYNHVYSLRNELSFQILKTGLSMYISQEVYTWKLRPFVLCHKHKMSLDLMNSERSG